MWEQRSQQSFLTAADTSPWVMLDAGDLQHSKPQPFCGDPEGWGPVSSIRYDFTPCFLDLWVVFVVAWGVLAGAGALWYLLRRRDVQEIPKNWHFYAKLYVQITDSSNHFSISDYFLGLSSVL